jgi:hypothetical protein
MSNFKPIKTPWGVMYLHNSRTVWYTRYEYDARGNKKECWMAYRTSMDHPSETPWCQDGMRIGDIHGYDTEEKAKTACLAHFDKMTLIKSGKWIYN